MLRGRENHYGDIAQAKIQSFVESLEDIYKADAPVKRSGNVFNVMMKPKK
jgi:translation initiation factor IF-3